MASALLVASVVGFISFSSFSDESDWRPIRAGQEFSTQELNAIQSAWRKQNLTEFRRVNRTLHVPQSELARYEAAAPTAASAADVPANEWDRQLSRANVFSSHEQLEQLKDNALRNELRRVLKAIPAIADADVIWARSKSRASLSARSKVTATVNVTPQDGQDVTPELARSLRTAVASMISDLNPQDIVVLDQSTGLAITDHHDPTIARQYQQRKLERLARQYASRIAEALSQIPNVNVTLTPVPSPAMTVRRTAAKPVAAVEPEDSERSVWATETPDLWASEVPREVAVLTSFSSATSHAETASHTELPGQATWSNEGPLHTTAWQVTLQIPQVCLDAKTVRQALSNSLPDELCETLSERGLRQLVANILPHGTEIADLRIEPTTLSVAAQADATLTFTAWPHMACLTVSVCLIALTLRLRPAPRDDSVSQQESQSIVASAMSESHAATSHCAVRTVETPDLKPVAERPRADDAPPFMPEGATHLTQDAHREATDALTSLKRLEPRRLAEALRHERPQAIAVLLSRFPSRLASETLSHLADNLQVEVIRRLRSLGNSPQELVEEIANAVLARMDSQLVPPELPIAPVNRLAHVWKTPVAEGVLG